MAHPLALDREWAPFAGSYAGLRNAEQQAQVGQALGPLAAEFAAVQRRCGVCHTGTDPGSSAPMRLPYDPNLQERRALAGRPTGEYERIVLERDPIARYSLNVLVNLTRPDRSPLLLAPLAKSAGGWGVCPDGFRTRPTRTISGYWRRWSGAGNTSPHLRGMALPVSSPTRSTSGSSSGLACCPGILRAARTHLTGLQRIKRTGERCGRGRREHGFG
ncbi:MAG: hypothetical protein M5U12_33305 [Verrucomicrobia bacterium]|nr:hypothetical protein [Verrucomicrobiota bacterium]